MPCKGLFLLGVDPGWLNHMPMPMHMVLENIGSSLDVIRDAAECMNMTMGNTWVLVSDVHECFDHLSHEWILEHAPMSKRYYGKYYNADTSIIIFIIL